MPAHDSGAVLCVTLNAALDVTYVVDDLRLHTVNRVSSVTIRGGGKGVNVARVMTQLGCSTVVTGFVGGHNGQLIRADVASAGLCDEFLIVAGESRRTLAVVADDVGDATMLCEPGVFVGSRDWSRFLAHYEQLLRREPAAVVLSGSLPPGVPLDGYADLAQRSHGNHVPVVLDADGDPLRLGAGGRPDIVKPTVEELRNATGIDDAVAAAEQLLGSGAGAVVVSVGAEGLLAVTPVARWRARPSERVHGNPTGAGDACVAALARGLGNSSWPERLRDAVALSASAVLRPVAGDVDLDAYHRYRNWVRVEEF